MPTRCKWYDNDGTPIRGGCKHPLSCPFIHPHQRDHRDHTRPSSYKKPIRCMYFDADGKAINGGCRFSSESCQFVHPEDPDWRYADEHKSRLQHSEGLRPSQTTHDQSLSQLQTASLTVGHDSPTTHSSMSSGLSALAVKSKNKAPMGLNIPAPKRVVKATSSQC
ncbi:hypothetical protein K439DRAFT_162909 [Ramaria rubella]|nr:hypothetical protein K439DRAFT_162909 [Ramaria rubella]